jgi:hypothetical protein
MLTIANEEIYGETLKRLKEFIHGLWFMLFILQIRDDNLSLI